VSAPARTRILVVDDQDEFRALLREVLTEAGFDVGEAATADAILLKPTVLDPFERERIKAHPVTGADLVRGLRTLEAARPIIRRQHERWDGSGYPDGLGGGAIPLEARILAVVDVYDALRTARPYERALPAAEAAAILCREAEAGWWDARVTTVLLDLLRETNGGTPS
jgi:putative two-component system response regulator